MNAMVHTAIYNYFVPAMVIGLLLPPIALATALISYLCHRNRVEPERRVPVFLYILALIVFGVAAGFAGMIEGNALACPAAGNLCGLFGVFATGPMSFSLAIMLIGLALFLIRPAPKR
jgi:uncharacterized membrane protein YhhN